MFSTEMQFSLQTSLINDLFTIKTTFGKYHHWSYYRDFTVHKLELCFLHSHLTRVKIQTFPVRGQISLQPLSVICLHKCHICLSVNIKNPKQKKKQTEKPKVEIKPEQKEKCKAEKTQSRRKTQSRIKNKAQNLWMHILT